MLRLSEYKVGLGRIRIHQPKSFSINVINDSDIDVKIVNVRAGCGKCTKASVSSEVVKAHGSVPLNVVFTPDSTGFVNKSVTINKEVILTFSAQVYN